ncbi:class E sortase [Nocardioides sp. LML1-1-1.1]|uniref:class E sortase n=1 Tax=Nocardioides sp. LML1-1-1.1 TaxID=3135248 RepID=UPI00343D5B0F
MTATVTPPETPEETSPRRARPARRAERPPRAPRAPRPPVQGTAAMWSSVSTMIALLCVWALLHVLVLAQVSHARAQDLLFREFRVQLAAATAPIDGSAEPGSPVAILRIPRLDLEQVVVEGTAPGDLFAGPGHRRNTVLPGQVGTSFVYGRAATYGAPFGHLDELKPGDRVEVTMGQGEVDFTVLGLRRSGDPRPQPAKAGAARLTLVSAEGAGRLSGLRPGEAIYVDAEASKGFASAGGTTSAVPESEEVMARGVESLPSVCLGLLLLIVLTLGVIAARLRWSVGLVWVVAAPVAIALAWFTTDAAMRLIPNLI